MTRIQTSCFLFLVAFVSFSNAGKRSQPDALAERGGNQATLHDDENTQSFLSSLQEEAFTHEETTQSLLKHFREAPRGFSHPFTRSGIDSAVHGIVPNRVSSRAMHEVEESPSTNHTEKSATPLDLGGLFQLGAEVLGLTGEAGTPEGEPGSGESENNTLVDFVGDVLASTSDGVYTNANVSIEDELQEVAEAIAAFGTMDPNDLSNLMDSVGSCVFCDAGDIIPDQELAGMKCSDWQAFSLLAMEDECAVLRAAAVESCGCQPKSLEATAKAETCNLCLDGSLEGVQLDTRIPTMSAALTCNDIAHLPAVEGDKTCHAVAAFGFVCGCPGTKPQCHLCSDGSAPSRPEAILHSTYVEHSDLGAVLQQSAGGAVGRTGNAGDAEDLTCASLGETLSVNTKSTCTRTIQDIEKITGLSIPAFCGCPTVNLTVAPTETWNLRGCDPCPAGHKLKSTTSFSQDDILLKPSLPTIQSCKEWVFDYAPFLDDETKCTAIQYFVASQCCDPVNPHPVEEDLDELSYSASNPEPFYFVSLFATSIAFAASLSQ